MISRRPLALVGGTLLLVLLVLLTGAALLSLRRADPPDPRRHDILREAPLTATPSDRPNVVVIVLDTTRAHFLDVYGGGRDASPALARVASESVVFDRAMSTSSWTAPATASIFTGRYPWRHGITTGFVWHRRMADQARARGETSLPLNRLRAAEVTLPERFRSLGYATAGVASNINIGDEIGFSDGFQRFERAVDRPAEHLVDRLASWRGDLLGAQPFFVYAHLNDPHHPYVVRPEHTRPTDAALAPDHAAYLAELRYLDAQIDALMDGLTTDRETWFVILSDHGEAFGEHGFYRHRNHLHDELVRALFLVHRRPEPLPARRVADVVSLADVHPTLAALVGVPLEGARDGRSLASFIHGEADPELRGRTVFAARRSDRDNWAAMTDRWKLIRHEGEPPILFDHARDPGEQHDQSANATEVAARLEEALAAQRDEATWTLPETGSQPLDAALEEHLETLGYIE